MHLSILRLLLPAFLACQALAVNTYDESKYSDLENDLIQRHCQVQGSEIRCKLAPPASKYGTGTKQILNHESPKKNESSQQGENSKQAQQKYPGKKISAKIKYYDEKIEQHQFIRRIYQYGIDNRLEGSDKVLPSSDLMFEEVEKYLEYQRELTMQFSVLNAVQNWPGVRKEELEEFCDDHPAICEDWYMLDK